jgi:tRNA-2-methylthio-N6-dimethylallyladenosine synthase
MPRTYYILTWGCQMNVHDSEKLAGALDEEGLAPAPSAAQADVILLNTCSIREKASEKVFSELGRLRALKVRRPDTVLGVMGCVAQQEGGRILERAPFVDLVVGPRATASLGPAVRSMLDGGRRAIADTEVRDDSIRFPFDKIRREGTAAGKAFVTVIEGCNHRCTFCIVPSTRGREICRPAGEVLEEVRRLVGAGIVEIELLGQTVNAYRDAEGHDLADLLLGASRIDGLRRLRFTTSHPAQMSVRLIDAMAAGAPVVCPYLHLPVQSGSSRVLAEMKRGYTRDGYLAKVDALRRRIPDLSLGTDVIVGFPTETEADFVATLSLLDEVEFDQVYSFTYSPRPGTAAASLDDPVAVGEKLERLRRLHDRQRAIQERRNAWWVGRVTEVLVEGPSRRDHQEWCGRTAENRVVNFPGPSASGRLERVRITTASAHSLRGERTPIGA